MTTEKRRHAVETITPERASEILAKSTNVRGINTPHANMLARAMATGAWRLNGETIKFTADGQCVDGQHRLRACVIAGVPFQTHAVYGVTAADVESIDTGRKRTTQDLLRHAGTLHAGPVSTALRLLFQHVTFGTMGPFNKSSRNVSIAPAELLRLLDLHPGLTSSVHRCTQQRIVTAPVLAVIHYLAQEHHPEAAECFVDDVTSGSNLKMDSPALALRDRFMENSRTRGKVFDIYHQRALVIKAWNAYVAHKPVALLKFDPREEFPVPIVGPLPEKKLKAVKQA